MQRKEALFLLLYCTSAYKVFHTMLAYQKMNKIIGDEHLKFYFVLGFKRNLFISNKNTVQKLTEDKLGFDIRVFLLHFS